MILYVDRWKNLYLWISAAAKRGPGVGRSGATCVPVLSQPGPRGLS